MRRLGTLLAIAVFAAIAAGVTASPALANGCTPGFWKNHTAIYDENATLSSVGIVVPPSLGLGDPSLITALNYGGGPGVNGAAKNLLRHGAAAYLNSVHLDFVLTMWVLESLNVALASLDADMMEAHKNHWANLNETLGCPDAKSIGA